MESWISLQHHCALLVYVVQQDPFLLPSNHSLRSLPHSGVEWPAFLRALQPVEAGELRWGGWDVLSVGAFGGCGSHGHGVRCWCKFGLSLLLFTPLLLSQQLLGLQQHTGVQAGRRNTQVTIRTPASLIAGVARVLFSRLEDLARGVDLIPGVLRHSTRVFTWLPEREMRGSGHKPQK